MGSNMAECHPVGFQWVMEARERGAEVIHVDPRFTRTSAVATKFVQIRAGSDIAFLGGIVNYILENGREFRDYVVHYTNAATIVRDDFKDTEDLDGLFSGFDPQKSEYDPTSWQYRGMSVHAAAGKRQGHGEQSGGAAGVALEHGEPPHEDPSLQHPRCVFQLLRRHFSRYTPEVVEQVCGTPKNAFLDVAETLCRNSGRERTSAFAYAVGWTQHTVGVQYIRTAAIIQLLLGNIGRPGGGIMALRGHASIQGSTDIPTLYNILPGYVPMPQPAHTSLEAYCRAESSQAGYWAHMETYVVSLLKAYYGESAGAENDFCFGHLPRITGDHSIYPAVLAMLERKVRGFLVVGENPAVGSANSTLHRLAMAKLEWLVVRDFFETESASFWYDSPEVETGKLRAEEIATEIFFLPAADHMEKDGSFTNTQRLLQWHHKALEPRGDCRSELWFYYHLGRRIREKLAGSNDPRDRPILDLAWEYPTAGPHAEPDARAVLREINGWDAQGRTLETFTALKADGSTTCGCWIYCGCFKNEKNQTANRTPGSEQSWVAPAWGWAWPANRRLLYNRASADPAGKPWSERKKYVWWDADKQEWTGHDVPDFKKTKAPDYVPPDGAKAEDALSGTEPFIMQADGKGWLFAPDGLSGGPFPAHYEPEESPFRNPLYGQRANPTRQRYPRPENPYHPSDGDARARVFPYVLTTYRLTEHHTAGGMTRTVPHLAEVQPEFFCEVNPALARARGLEHGGWATIVTGRSAVEARVLVTERIGDGTIGLPYHWGRKGIATGESANDLLPIVTDPNVHIQESKAATCDIRPGRRPRGEGLSALVNQYRERAGLPVEV
ncbi:MAG: molybdopterin-dependent oxidoreductase [Candidatus Eremiobacteraeota bacterium]|nr:molybdopterin-dependent oxidoreductase [Candidatus Eremiobacteraeota bacterium]